MILLVLIIVTDFFKRFTSFTHYGRHYVNDQIENHNDSLKHQARAETFLNSLHVKMIGKDFTMMENRLIKKI